MQLRDLLREHARQLGGGALTLDSHGTCHLMVNDNPPSDVGRGRRPILFSYSEVIALPPQENEEIFKRLLQANLYGRATQGCVFALDAHGTHVILFKEFPTEIYRFSIYLDGFEVFIQSIRQILERPFARTFKMDNSLQ